MTELTMHLPSAGDLFARRFLVEGPVASGGMGVILRAVDRGSGKPVALKLLQNLGGATEVERFRREAGILDELRHPHIVSYVAHGLDESGRRYLAMEWLDGEELAQRLRRGPLPMSEAVALLHGVSAALAEATRMVWSTATSSRATCSCAAETRRVSPSSTLASPAARCIPGS